MDYSRPELADLLAADYVVGSLRGAARRRFEALLPAHPVLRSAMLDWQQRLMPLTLAIAPQRPSARVWQRIEERLHGGGGNPAAVTALQQPPRLGWWAQIAFWRGLSMVAGVAAVTLGVLLASPGPAQPPIVVVLGPAAPDAAAGTPPSFVASISPDGRAVVTRPLQNVSIEPGRALELWSVPGSGAPRSLGLIAANAPTVVRNPRLLDRTNALAVSLEPPGGSPTGAPTGPVLYLGRLAP